MLLLYKSQFGGFLGRKICIISPKPEMLVYKTNTKPGVLGFLCYQVEMVELPDGKNEGFN